MLESSSKINRHKRNNILLHLESLTTVPHRPVKLTTMSYRGPLKYAVLALTLALIVHGAISGDHSEYGLMDPSNSSSEKKVTCTDPECTFNPPPENSNPGGEESKDLFETLKDGMDTMSSYPHVPNAILLLGNTGSGKSTLAQILVGNLSQIYSVCSAQGNLVIVDQDEKIGLPSTKSKTLVPDLFVKPNGNVNESFLYFYDCPGFDDTRGPEMDVAANFFMNRVTRKATNLKLLFVVPNNNLAFGTGDRRSFDELVSHVVRFVRDLEKFSESVGLVVTMVPNFDPNDGLYISDSTHINKFITFFKIYMDDKGCKNTSDTNLLKKCRFVELLLQRKSSDEQYDRIWLVRTPIACGPLSNLTDMTNSRGNVTQLIDGLSYTTIDSEKDFFFTLSGDTLVEVQNYTATSNIIVKELSHQVASDALEFYRKSVQEQTSWQDLDMQTRIKSLQATSNSLMTFIKSAENMTFPTELISAMRSCFEFINFTVPMVYQVAAEDQEAFLNFFSEVTGKPQSLIEQWLVPLNDCEKRFKEYARWYEFIYNVEENVLSYKFHYIEHEPPKHNESWFDYLQRNAIPVSDDIREISTKITNSEIHVLGEIMNYTLQPLAVTCESQNNTLIFRQNFLKISTLNITDKLSTCGATKVRIHSAHTIFWDLDTIELTDADLVIIAPTWMILKENQVNIRLDGSVGKPYGNAAKSTDDRMGIDGAHGLSGRFGKQGGNFIGLARKMLGANIGTVQLNVKTISGNGGPGQTGGSGDVGTTRNASPRDLPDMKDCCDMENTRKVCYHVHFGVNGGSGGIGGDGGCGGKPGSFNGQIVLHELEHNSDFTFGKSYQFGKAGRGGEGGSGGAGGKVGFGYENVGGTFYAVDACCNRVNGVQGNNGLSGTSNLEPDEKESEPRLVVVQEEVLSYRISQISNAFKDLRQFLSLIDKSAETQHFWNLSTLAYEAVALENLKRDEIFTSDILNLYDSFIYRLEVFANGHFYELSKEHQVILQILLARSYTTRMSLQAPRGFGVIVDVWGYFELTKKRIEALETQSTLISIEVEKVQFVKQVQAKIDQCLAYIDTVVHPALLTAEAAVSKETESFEKSVEALVVQATLSLQEIKTMLVEAERNYRYMQKLVLAESIGSIFLGLVPNMPSLDAVFSKLEKKFNSQEEELQRLKILKAQAEETIGNLKLQQAYFVNEFKPLVEPLLTYFRNISMALSAGNPVISPQLVITKWQLINKLNEFRQKLEPLKDMSISSETIVRSIDVIMDTMSMSIDLYQLIDQYIDTQNIANYIGAVVASNLTPVHITDPDFKNIFQTYEQLVERNMLNLELNRAVHAFKQWVFPFAHIYTHENVSVNGNGLIDVNRDDFYHLRIIETLLAALESYKSSTIGGQDTYVRQSNFSSAFTTTKPFYTWNGPENRNVIEQLTKGDKIELLADITKNNLIGKDAIKFKQIEINLKLTTNNNKLKEDFDVVLRNFGVTLVHSGVSNYRLLDKYFIMNSLSQTFIYNFEWDTDGNRQGRNDVYNKFRDGVFMLSPFTQWTVQLRLESSQQTIMNRTKSTQITFSDLEKFAPLIELELVGIGTYVDVSSFVASNEDLMLEYYYAGNLRPYFKSSNY